MLATIASDLAWATAETAYMVGLSSLLAIGLGLPLGTWVFCAARLKPNRLVHKSLSALINMTRSVPFIILLVALIPFTRLLIGTSIGLHAAIVPLTIGAIPLFARLTDNILQNLPAGLIEAGQAMGASHWQMIRLILLPEALPALIQAVTMTAITLINYSAMAGTVGGGGLGDLAIRYGYQRFDVSVMISTVVLLILMVQMVQMLGDYLVRCFSH